EAFLYTDEDRTLYFAFRPVQEKDDKGKVIRKYVYGIGTGNAEAEAFTLCRSYYDESLREDVQEPITDPNYAKIERVSDVGEYEVYKITIGKDYDNYGLMTRLIKKNLKWDQLGNGEWGYTEEYQNDGEDDFYINMQEKPSGLMTAWPDGDSFPHDMEAYEKTKHIDVGNHARIAVGFVTENENGYQMTPVNEQISLLNEDGNPVGEDSSITKTGDGIYELYIPKCGNYKLAYKETVNGEAHIYYANIVSKLPDIAFYSDTNPSDQNMVNNGSEEYRYDNGATYYLCHNFDEWRLNNEIDSITITSPSFGEEFKKSYDAAYIKSHKVLDEIIITDDMSEAYFEVTIKKKDQVWDDQRDFHFMKTAEGFSVGWPGDNASVSTDPKDYQGKIHVNMRCHEWRTFAVITSDDDNKKTVTPIPATQQSLGDFSITDSEGQEVADEDAYISLAYPEGDARDGLFEVFFNKPGQYRIYYGDEFVVVNCAIENVAFAEKQGTFSSKNYEIMSDDPFGADVGSVDEADFYIATLDESDSGYDRYDSTIIKGIEIKNPIEQDENFKKNFTYEISEDGTGAKIHVDRNVNLDFIDFEVVYDVKSFEKDGDGYSQRGSWEGRDYFNINIPEDERTLIDISKVKWSVYDFVYDNTSKSVTLTGLSDEYKDIVDIKYTDNSKKDIGKYTAKAEIKIKDDYKTKYRLPRPIPENISSLEWQIVIPANVKAIIDSINILPAKDKVVIADKVKIESIRKAYDALKDYEKSIIEEATLKKLTEAEKAIKTLEEKQAEADKPDKPKKTEKNPAKVGATITDNKSKVQYKVTKAGAKNKTGEVSFKKLKSKTLSKFTIPKTISVDGIKYTVTAIENGAFKGQKKLKSISIPDSVTKIGDNAFNGCISLHKITISKGVKRIGAKAFYGCKKLKTIVVKPKTMTKIGNNAFKGIHPKAVIKVPKGKKAYYDKKFANKGLAATVKIKEP
ncbi:MAG: leucine-rich repeat protein, partial [Eubacterium sp.]|nr:leucine-rich repeat protein [Eubacterium sp.]